MKLKPLFTTLLLSTTLLGGNAMAQNSPLTHIDIPAQHIEITQEWDKIFPQSDKVHHHKVAFANRYGITLVGDLYIPKNAKGKLPAIAVSGPFGAVKEQVSGLYAQTLAERGFITLAFDPSYTGESSGLPRNQASPEINTEDFIAAVDFLNAQENVQTDHVGILGICGFGGMALNAAAVDTHIKAVATSTMYDMSRVLSKGYNDSMTAAERLKIKQDISDARQDLAKSGYAGTLPRGNITVDQITPDTPEFIANYSRFYTTKRGFHPRSVNSDPKGWWTNTSLQAFMNMPLLSYANEITAPTLIAVGENAHSRYFSEDAFKAVGAKDKQLLIIPNATHTDLYDNLQKIPFDAFADFFKKNL
ncbi:membrane protein [Gallibacterium anatis]|uniref:alpha/beta hydrolase n=1 Tax=Gallibacterium anatis TaxID=750 RepID=UPI000531DD02|nr:alpha/beta hydrolase [Gallibacterium anatis]KGQ41042.1 membrane protein [Gallibacterium anatis]KGQ47821.1 membrane protein [Gallibacterium anatis]KGQ59448.1 membrane protein [Gallibacterium anatis]